MRHFQCPQPHPRQSLAIGPGRASRPGQQEQGSRELDRQETRRCLIPTVLPEPGSGDPTRGSHSPSLPQSRARPPPAFATFFMCVCVGDGGQDLMYPSTGLSFSLPYSWDYECVSSRFIYSILKRICLAVAGYLNDCMHSQEPNRDMKAFVKLYELSPSPSPQGSIKPGKMDRLSSNQAETCSELSLQFPPRLCET